MISFFLHYFVFGAAVAASLMEAPSSHERARQLKDYIQKEKPHFTQRENQRRSLLEELDRLNSEQNTVRQRVGSITMNQQELTMALENMKMEVEKQRGLEEQQKKRMLLLLKLAYKVKKEGLVRFVVTGQNLSSLAGRVRVLYYTLRSHTILSKQLAERAGRLSESERKLSLAKLDIQKLIGELKEQEDLLTTLLKRKHQMLSSLNLKQGVFQNALKEYKQASNQVSTLFTNFETLRESDDAVASSPTNPGRGSLPLPIEVGHIVKNFGRSVHERFHTVTYHKGIEIEADHNTPVSAIMAGVVEYDGWLKGLGNVVILHHGGGFYSLSAHLYRSLKARGTKVQQGEAIGLVGDTGSSEKPSLYFEIRENGKAVDPIVYFSPLALKSLH